MRVHVLKSVEVSMARYEELMELLDAIPGPVSFVASEFIPTFEDDEHEIRFIRKPSEEELEEIDFPDLSFSSFSRKTLCSRCAREIFVRLASIEFQSEGLVRRGYHSCLELWNRRARGCCSATDLR
jgi:hypothetical protein